jgi:hypothetical protein
LVEAECRRAGRRWAHQVVLQNRLENKVDNVYRKFYSKRLDLHFWNYKGDRCSVEESYVLRFGETISFESVSLAAGAAGGRRFGHGMLYQGPLDKLSSRNSDFALVIMREVFAQPGDCIAMAFKNILNIAYSSSRLQEVLVLNQLNADS